MTKCDADRGSHHVGGWSDRGMGSLLYSGRRRLYRRGSVKGCLEGCERMMQMLRLDNVSGWGGGSLWLGRRGTHTRGHYTRTHTHLLGQTKWGPMHNHHTYTRVPIHTLGDGTAARTPVHVLQCTHVHIYTVTHTQTLTDTPRHSQTQGHSYVLYETLLGMQANSSARGIPW